MIGAKDVYHITGNSKEQITTFCAISAKGDIIPPMHIFAGKHFKVDPMSGCVPNAYFGKSDKGWINIQLFLQVAGRAFHKIHWNNSTISAVDRWTLVTHL